jgi:hypothetical protein
LVGAAAAFPFGAAGEAADVAGGVVCAGDEVPETGIAGLLFAALASVDAGCPIGEAVVEALES